MGKHTQLDLVRSIKKKTMIYSDLLRFVGLLAGRWLTLFQALTE